MVNIELQKEWEERVAEFRSSGLSAAAWSAAHDVNIHRLRYWLQKFRATDAPSTHPAQWLPVESDDSSVGEASLLVRVGQATVEVKPGFDPGLLAGVVRTLISL